MFSEAAAAQAASIAAAHVEADGDAYRIDDTDSTVLPSLVSADVVSERALVLLLLLSQFERHQLGELEPEPEPAGPRSDAEVGSAITNAYLDGIGFRW